MIINPFDNEQEFTSSDKLITHLTQLAVDKNNVFRGYGKQSELFPNIIREKDWREQEIGLSPLQSNLPLAPISAPSPVTTKCGRRGLVSSTPTFFAAVPASLVPRHTALAQFRYTPAPRHPVPPHGYGGKHNRFFHSGGIHGTHIPHDSCHSSSES